MKLVQLTTVPISRYFIEGQPRYMKKHGIDTIYISSPGNLLDTFGEVEECETFGVEMSRQVSPIDDARSIVQLVARLRKIQPQIIHTHTPKGGLLGMIAAAFVRVPVKIYNIQGLTYMGQKGVMRRVMMASERIACKLADQVICVSPSIADVAVKDGLVSKEKIKVLANGTANGVDADTKFNPSKYTEDDLVAAREEYRIEPNSVVTTYVGRLAIDKGIRELTAAWEQVEMQNPEAVLLIVGEPDDRDPLDADTLNRLEQMASVRIVGHQSDVAKIFAISDIAVLPTYREGFPTVILEAASMQVPMVATNIPGCIDAVGDGETGILVQVKQSAALADAILVLINDPEKREQYGRAGRRRVIRDYDPEHLWAAILEEYRRLCLARNHK